MSLEIYTIVQFTYGMIAGSLITIIFFIFKNLKKRGSNVVK